MINIESIDKIDGKIHVKVSLKPYCNRRNPHYVLCTTNIIEKILKERKVLHGKCLRNINLFNDRKKTCTGTWVFEAPAPPPPAPIKKRSQSRRSKKREKTLDKTSEDVIIDNREKTSEE